MNYKLAKQLKDAGYPQPKYFTAGNYYEKNDEMIVIPTLSELIDACGDKFDSLSIGEDKKWICMGGEWNEDYGIEFIIEGETYEESVAKLWLEINKYEKRKN